MAQLKRDHSGYHSYGLYKKYQQPAIEEKTVKRSSKKNTNKWCRGKVGKHHEWHSYQQKYWSDERWRYVDYYIIIKCHECSKQKYTKMSRSRIYPLHLWIDQQNKGYQSIQVKSNGKVLPIEEYQYHTDKYWCSNCYSWHRK